MFTGIIEEIGEIVSYRNGQLEIKASLVLEDCQIGDSIAVNGVCLTVKHLSSHHFIADCMPETMRSTNLETAKIVNLERAMSANGRFGGHIVSGHIDGTGILRHIAPEKNAIWMTIETSAQILRYIIPKGSIAIDGISLTVQRVDSSSFGVSLIPHSLENTNLKDKRVGSIVNLENDLVGKYVEKLLQKEPEGISLEFLQEHGF